MYFNSKFLHISTRLTLIYVLLVNWISSKSSVHECRGRSQGLSPSYDSSSDVGSLVRQAANLHQSYCRGSKKNSTG